MTGTYPSFMATQDGRAILGRQPTLQDMVSSVAQGAPTSTGGYGGGPQGLGYPGGGQTITTGTGDRAMGSPYFNLTFGQPAAGGGSAGPAIGGGGRGIALPPGAQTPSTPVPGQGVPTGAGGGVTGAPGGALTVQQLLRQLGMTGGGAGGGGAGGAGGTAPGGIGAGQTAPESGNQFAAANAAVNPSVMNSLNIASSVMSPLTGLPGQLLATAFPGLSQILDPMGLGYGTGFNVKGPQLSPQQLNQVSQAYQTNPALAARLLATMRQQANIAGGAIGGGMLNRTGQTPMGSFGTTPQNELTANFTSPGFGLNPAAAGFGGYATWGGPGGGFQGGGGLGGGSPDTGGGLGGGVGNMGGGQNRSF